MLDSFSSHKSKKL